MGRGRCAGSMRGAIERRPPCPPGVSRPASALPHGPLGRLGLLGAPGPWGAGSLFPAGPTGEPGGPAPRGWTRVGPHRRFPGPLRVPPPRRLRGRPPGAGGAGRTGRATGTSVSSLGGCWRPPPCHPPGLQRALRVTPGVPASPRLCSTCLHTGGISLVLWPLAPGGAAPAFGWRALALVRRAGWPVEPCVAPTRGPGPTHQGLVLRARARDSVPHRVAHLSAATLASAWRRFGGRACPFIPGRGRLVASGTLRSGPPAGALGRRGAPLPATLPASLPWRCP